ncbi:hypothetical protein A7310_19940 [Bacillus velezensis]|nr:hypothetical protein A7310_19940 [Bacillus velezensis]
MDRHLLHVLHGCRHKGLFPDVWKTAQTAIAKPMELFGIREASFNRLFSFAVQLFTRWAQPVAPYPLFAVFPDMPSHHFAVVSRLGTLT